MIQTTKKSVNFFDLAVNIMMTFNYSVELRNHLQEGSTTMRSLASLAVFLYRLVMKYTIERDRSGQNFVEDCAAIKIRGISVRTLLPGAYRVGEVIGNGAVLRAKLG